jgi:hypothetical protein
VAGLDDDDVVDVEVPDHRRHSLAPRHQGFDDGRHGLETDADAGAVADAPADATGLGRLGKRRRQSLQGSPSPATVR